MPPSLLLDTHILIRWLLDARKLYREQRRVIEGAIRRAEPLAFSAITLLEIALLVSEEKLELDTGLGEYFRTLQANRIFRVLPITHQTAEDAAMLGPLRDPMDRAIAATARVHHLRLVTSDLRIIESELVRVVE